LETQPCIISIGTSVPEHRVTQEQLFSFISSTMPLNREQTLRLRKILSYSGIKTRHTVLKDFGVNKEDFEFFPNDGSDLLPSLSKRMAKFQQTALNLCLDAVTDCLNPLPAGIKKSISHVITFSCTGMYAPGLDIELVEQLDLDKGVERTCINFMGCYAAFNALKSAYHILRSHPESQVLIVGVELCSLHYNHSSEQDQLIANSIFGDGASAVMLSNSIPEKRIGFQLQKFYSEFASAGKNDMVWCIGEDCFNLKLSGYVPEMIKGGIGNLINKLFEKSSIKQTDISYYAIHPGGMKILKACEDALNITPAQNSNSYKVLNDYGNMSSVTVLFVLKEYLKNMQKEDIGKKVLSCAFGPGLTMESMLLKVI